MLTERYKNSMRIGNRFRCRYEVEKTSEWNGTEECATLTELTCRLMETHNISADTALDMVMDKVIENNYRLGRVTDHGWDDYTRGFLAGQILGWPTEENIKKAEAAETLWDNDDGGEYGYYQEVLDEVAI